MTEKEQEDAILRSLIHWAEGQETVRAMLMTSTRTNPNTPRDIFSDYDIVLAVTDIYSFFENRDWLQAFGNVLLLYRDPIYQEQDCGRFAYITQYEDGTKIDFTVMPVELLRRIAALPQLPDDLDVGYAVLLDKDRLTEGMLPPSYRAYIPVPPTEAAYQTLVAEFFHETTYVAKNLWRDELLPAKYSLDEVMKQHYLRPLLEWRIEIDHDWSVKTGAYGKGLKKRLAPARWAELEATYAGAGLEENWTALFRTIDLFCKVAAEVADHLGFAYPQELEQRVRTYLLKVKNLDRQAKAFSF